MENHRVAFSYGTRTDRRDGLVQNVIDRLPGVHLLAAERRRTLFPLCTEDLTSSFRPDSDLSSLDGLLQLLLQAANTRLNGTRCDLHRQLVVRADRLTRLVAEHLVRGAGNS